jgi:hypothetical protein
VYVREEGTRKHMAIGQTYKREKNNKDERRKRYRKGRN